MQSALKFSAVFGVTSFASSNVMRFGAALPIATSKNTVERLQNTRGSDSRECTSQDPLRVAHTPPLLSSVGWCGPDLTSLAGAAAAKCRAFGARMTAPDERAAKVLRERNMMTVGRCVEGGNKETTN